MIQVREFRLPDQFPAGLSLGNSEIHVWHRRRDPEEAELERLRTVLSNDELARAARFRFEKDRNEFIVSRGMLRCVLGSYISKSPTDLQFQYSEFGRPMLTAAANVPSIDFNVSHSGGVILWAFAQNRRIGVDVEELRPDFDTLEIAERFFSTSERQTLRSLPPDRRPEAFFRCWTRKESFIKALGEGLSHPLDQFDVTLATGAPAQLLATRPNASDVKAWAMWDISVPDGYAAALTAELR